jgi:hypothetical protein
MTDKFLEEPKNPGLDDGQCANVEKCGSKKLDEDARCFGCGYLICVGCSECDTPWGAHLVIQHWEENEDDEGEF